MIIQYYSGSFNTGITTDQSWIMDRISDLNFFDLNFFKTLIFPDFDFLTSTFEISFLIFLLQRSFNTTVAHSIQGFLMIDHGLWIRLQT